MRERACALHHMATPCAMRATHAHAGTCHDIFSLSFFLKKQVAQALKSALAARSGELLDDAIGRAITLLAAPTPAIVLRPEATSSIARSDSEASAQSSSGASSLPLHSLVERSESGLEQGKATIANLLETAQALRNQVGLGEGVLGG